MPDLTATLAHEYISATKFYRQAMFGDKVVDIMPTQAWKMYEDVPEIVLPTENIKQQQADFWQLAGQRRSVRRYSEEPLSLDELAALLWAAQGVTGVAGTYMFRAAPSGGALFPIETYLTINHVRGLIPGLYHFNPVVFKLYRLTSHPVGDLLAEACMGQRFVSRAAVTCLWSAVFRRNLCKYKERGLRYILMDVGHICQNLLLASEALGLKSCPVGAFFDDELNDLLDLDGVEESVVYLAAIGQPVARE